MTTLQINNSGRSVVDVTIPKSVVRIDASLAEVWLFDQTNEDVLIALPGLSDLAAIATAYTFGSPAKRLTRQSDGSYIASEPIELNGVRKLDLDHYAL